MLEDCNSVMLHFTEVVKATEDPDKRAMQVGGPSPRGDGGMVEWWIGGMVKWLNGEMVKWCNGEILSP